MEDDLRKLLDDQRFREYHREFLTPEFNTFDVLRYSNYEIRHSNVLAWLLQPTETHGIEDRFLKWFVDHVNERIGEANRKPLPTVNFEATNIEVKREEDNVDITIFFRKERCLIAIENKTGPASSDHFDQVRCYEEKLRGKHRNHTVQSVLLTTLPARNVNFPNIIQVGWKSVYKEINSLQKDGAFRPDSVDAFVQQYLDLLERQFGFTEGGGVMSLLDCHHSILEKMLRLQEKDGADSVREQVPEDRAEYRDALVRLVQESRQDPKRLRKVVADHLKNQDCTTQLTQTHNVPKWYSVNWTDKELEKPSRILGGKSDFLRWSMTFTNRDVGVGFYLYQPEEKRENSSSLDRLIHFIEDTLIDRLEPNRYQIADHGYGWHEVYYQTLLSEDEFANMSVSESQDKVLQRLKDFMGSNESDYRRIDEYFRCLAFRPDVPTSTRKESP